MVLMRASNRGHTEAIEELMANGAEVNAANDDYDTALMLSSCQGHTKAIELLVAKGAEVSANENGTTSADAHLTPRACKGDRGACGKRS